VAEAMVRATHLSSHLQKSLANAGLIEILWPPSMVEFFWATVEDVHLALTSMP